jgi:hypothetical protein
VKPTGTYRRKDGADATRESVDSSVLREQREVRYVAFGQLDPEAPWSMRCPYCDCETPVEGASCVGCKRELAAEPKDMSEVTSQTWAYQSPKSKPRAIQDCGWVLLGLPLVGALLSVLFSETLGMVVVGVVLSTAAVAAYEWSKAARGRTGTFAPVLWFGIVFLFWAVGYPAYMYYRQRNGLKNRLFWALVAEGIFLGALSTFARVRGDFG